MTTYSGVPLLHIGKNGEKVEVTGMSSCEPLSDNTLELSFTANDEFREELENLFLSQKEEEFSIIFDNGEEMSFCGFLKSVEVAVNPFGIYSTDVAIQLQGERFEPIEVTSMDDGYPKFLLDNKSVDSKSVYLGNEFFTIEDQKVKKCAYCSTEPIDNEESCYNCGADIPYSDSWECPCCTRLNRPSRDYCRTCGVSKFA